jgi:hypothetical protein
LALSPRVSFDTSRSPDGPAPSTNTGAPSKASPARTCIAPSPFLSRQAIRSLASQFMKQAGASAKGFASTLSTKLSRAKAPTAGAVV